MITQFQIDIGLGYPLPAPCGCKSNVFDISSNAIHCMCRPYDFIPLIPGDDWEMGIKAEQLVIDPVTKIQSIEAIDLTDALCVFTLKIIDTDPVGFTRRSDADLPDILPAKAQIGIDDQTTDNGENGVSGKGWMRLRFAHTEQADLLPFVGLLPYDLKIKLLDGTTFTLMRGRFEAVRTITGQI